MYYFTVEENVPPSYHNWCAVLTQACMYNKKNYTTKKKNERGPNNLTHCDFWPNILHVGSSFSGYSWARAYWNNAGTLIYYRYRYELCKSTALKSICMQTCFADYTIYLWVWGIFNFCENFGI
jgi:hypothetical protein